jgi:hypothetical protein
MYPQRPSHPTNSEHGISPQLREFIERVVVPLLVARYCGSWQAQEPSSLRLVDDPEEPDPAVAA